MRELTKNLHEYCDKYTIITIFACNKDKDYQEMLDLLIPVTDYFILTKSHVQIKATEPEFLAKYLINLNKDHQIVTDYSQTIKFASKILSERNFNNEKVLVCICGSLYLVGAIRSIINEV